MAINISRARHTTVFDALKHFLAATLTACTLLFVGSCSSDNPTEPEGDPQPVVLGVEPVSAPPAALVKITGITIPEISLDSHYVLIGGEFSLVFVDTAGVVYTTVPGFIDTLTLWPSPPLEAVGIAVMRGPDTIGFGESLLTVEPLAEAPGTLDQYVTDMQTVTESVDSIVGGLFDSNWEVSMLLYGYSKAIDSFMTSDDDSLFLSAINDLKANDTTLKLADALLASSGMAEYMSSFANDMSGIAASLAAGDRESAYRQAAAFSTSDVSLAASMQMQVLMSQRGTFLRGLAGGLSFTSNVTGFLGLFTSFARLFEKLPGFGTSLSVISLATSLKALFVEKFVASAMPSKIKELTIDLTEDTIKAGDKTDAEFHIVAMNDPSPLTLNDIVSVVMSSMGTWGSIAQKYVSSSAISEFLSNHLDDVQKSLDNAVLWIVNNVRSQLDKYAKNNPNVVYDPGILDIGNAVPTYEWEADIVTPELLALRTLHPTKIDSIDSELNWEAKWEEWGDASIYAEPSREQAAQQLSIPGLSYYFGEYNAGAFGLDVSGSDRMPVVIQPDLDVQIQMNSTIDTVNFEPVTIEAGYRDEQGQTVPFSNIQLALSANGGTIQATAGATDAQGQFETQVKLVSGSSQVTVQVDATGDAGAEASNQATAAAGQSGIPIDLLLGMPGGFKITPTVPKDFRVIVGNYPRFATGLTVSLTAVNGSISPATGVTDSTGWFIPKAVLDGGEDSMVVYVTVSESPTNVVYDTAVIYSYCLPTQDCTFSESGFGTYTANGSCTGGTLTASASPGGNSSAEIRFQDRVSVIASDTSLWTERGYAWYTVDVTWSVQGGDGSQVGLQAELTTPYSGGQILRVANSGQTDNGSFTIEVAIRVDLAPWDQELVNGRIEALALPDDTQGNEAITNTVTMTVTGVSRVTLLDRETPVEVICVESASGLPYNGP